ncbi:MULTISPECIES: hypothetical protein [Burkholderia cepacia complex]|uniref:hypothetical protein n=1 Tax=Burkholderia cepacia complex TaxID=87882 RepID=UPI0013DDCDA2|nr:MULTISPECIES: hypothetical protein [Burkholderia cepacia complex]
MPSARFKTAMRRLGSISWGVAIESGLIARKSRSNSHRVSHVASQIETGGDAESRGRKGACRDA